MNINTIFPRHTYRLKSSAPIACVLLAACSNSSDTSTTQNEATSLPSPEAKEAIIDASAYDQYVYFNLDKSEVVDLNETQAQSSTEWHIAFKRTSIILNGGTSGPGNVAGAISALQDDFYDAEGEPETNVFLNASAEQEAEHLNPNLDISALDLISDSHLPAIQSSGETLGTQIDMGWYFYNFATHQTSLNSESWWLLRSNSGNSYAKFHATSFSYDSSAGLNVTFEFEVQSEASNQFSSTATFVAAVGASGGESCFDFDAQSTVSCDSNEWDIRLEIAGRNWNLWTNSGISGDGSGGAFGPFSQADIDDYYSGQLSPDGTSIDSHYAADSNAGIFNENSWYAYNLEGRHKLWPNYRSYVIDTDTSDSEAPKYQLQITNYYSDTGVSGHPNIRFIEVNERTDSL